MIHTRLPIKDSHRTFHRFTVDEYERMIELGILTENHPVELIRGEVAMRNSIRRYRFTTDEYERMITAGILTEDDRVELNRGEAIEEMSVGDPHIACILRLTRKFPRILDDSVFVSVQNAIKLVDSEPLPDVGLLRYRDDYYATRKARPSDILLLIEVADSSLQNDREVKIPLYAESGIVEYWIVNLIDDCIEVYRSPQPDGTYAEKRVLRRGERIEIEAIAGAECDVADLLP
jgi:Uma2 family endonuclease